MSKIKISSKREGFRRCGIAHSFAPTIHADGVFTSEQVKILQAEPMLHVEVLPDDEPAPAPAPAPEPEPEPEPEPAPEQDAAPPPEIVPQVQPKLKKRGD